MSDIILVRVEAISLFTLARGEDRRIRISIGICITCGNVVRWNERGQRIDSIGPIV